MKIISLDLSSKCVGCFVVKLQEDNVVNCASYPFYPKHLSPESLGFKKTKKKITTPKSSYSSFVIEGEEHVSKKVKQERDRAFRQADNVHILKNISEEIAELITKIHPDLIIIEKNEIFGGVLTSILLSKINGVIHGLGGGFKIPIKEYHVTAVRRHYPITKKLKELSETMPEDEYIAIPDKSKHAVKCLMEEKYPITFNSYDESDAALVFDYWFEKEKNNG